jgi:hypothetical protein
MSDVLSQDILTRFRSPKYFCLLLRNIDFQLRLTHDCPLIMFKLKDLLYMFVIHNEVKIHRIIPTLLDMLDFCALSPFRLLITAKLR